MLKKICVTVGLCALCVITVLLGGCSIYEKEDLAKMVARIQEMAKNRRKGKVVREKDQMVHRMLMRRKMQIPVRGICQRI